MSIDAADRCWQDAALAGRTIETVVSATGGNRTDVTWHATPSAEISHDEGSLRATFRGSGAVHEVRAVFAHPPAAASGVTARFLLRGWESLRYVAVGRTVDGAFRHVKVRHVLQGEWVEVSVDDRDLATRIQAGWTLAPAGPSGDVRVYVNGVASGNGSDVLVDRVASWTATGKSLSSRWEATSQRAVDVRQALIAYLRRKNPTLNDDARHYLETGEFPILPGTFLPWPPGSTLPDGISEIPTYRYIWHSLYPAAYLLLHAEQESNRSAHGASLRLVDHWLSQSYYKEDPDQRYAWYDHGTAERLIALLLVRTSFDYANSDKRFRSRIDDAILEHAFLLENEAFYAANQRDRFHNHAWFQDLALLAAGALAPSDAASRWIETGRRRLKQQIKRLVCTEGMFSVFVENSVGYHHGIQILVEFAAKLLELVADDTDLLDTAAGLARWSERLRYEDGRSPSTGDTFRLPNPTEPGPRHLRREAGSVVLQDAGYAIAEGADDAYQFTFCFFATALSSTHKHADNLSFTLSLDGVEWLIDPSFFSHDYASPVPSYLRGPMAHSAPHVEGYEYSIEPGNAQLSGDTETAGVFLFRGRHSAVRDHVVTRRIYGRTDRLEIHATDRVIGPASPLAVGRFHLGDGVVPEAVGSHVTLSHPATDTRLLLDLSSAPQILQGWTGDPATSSVSGTGFRRLVDTSTITAPFDSSGELRWSITRTK